MKETWVEPWVGKIPRRREWLPTPVFLPGESHGQRSLAGFSSWGHKESDTIERLTHTHTHTRSNFRSIIDIFIALYSTTQERKGNFSQASLLG